MVNSSAMASDFTIVFEFLYDKSDDEIEEWEKSIGFKSFRRVFDQSDLSDKNSKTMVKSSAVAKCGTPSIISIPKSESYSRISDIISASSHEKIERNKIGKIRISIKPQIRRSWIKSQNNEFH